MGTAQRTAPDYGQAASRRRTTDLLPSRRIEDAPPRGPLLRSGVQHCCGGGSGKAEHSVRREREREREEKKQKQEETPSFFFLLLPSSSCLCRCYVFLNAKCCWSAMDLRWLCCEATLQRPLFFDPPLMKGPALHCGCLHTPAIVTYTYTRTHIHSCIYTGLCCGSACFDIFCQRDAWTGAQP